VVAPRQKLSSDEYLAWEREQPTKHEYYRGEVFAMAGGSVRHNHLCSVLIALLRERLAAQGCIVLTSDQRVALDASERYVYPDVTVVCGPPHVEHGDVIVNPAVIVEVLALSTEQHDRGSKWSSYQQLPSLRDYILLPQWIPRIELFSRDDAGGWSYRAAGAGERLVLSTRVELAIDEVFAGAMALPGDAPPPLTSGRE
jgi:Uma2 family endonuclease